MLSETLAVVRGSCRSEDPRAARKKKLSLVQLGEHMGLLSKTERG